jgi:hypothetical protein
MVTAPCVRAGASEPVTVYGYDVDTVEAAVGRT